MTKNVGTTDRIIRIAVAVIIAILYWQGIITGTLAYVLIAVAVALLVTSFIRFCGLYTLLGVTTCPRK